MTDYPLPNNAWELSSQVALVTGTTSGLGWRFAQVLAKAGAKVALTGRRTERLDELAQLSEQISGCIGQSPTKQTIQLEEEQIRQLKSLGYIR